MISNSLLATEADAKKNPGVETPGALAEKAATHRVEDLATAVLPRSVTGLAVHSIEPVHELLQRLVLELADSLARQPQVLADFAKGHG